MPCTFSCQRKFALPWHAYSEEGIYACRLCRGKATVWSPMYDPLFINPCLCPTCDGMRWGHLLQNFLFVVRIPVALIVLICFIFLGCSAA
jgi:hypothetical protein